MSFPQTLHYGVTAASTATRNTVYFTVVTTGAQTATISALILTGKHVFVDWGDGTVTDYTGTGSDQNLSRAYAGAGTFYCKLYGDIGSITKFVTADSKLRLTTDQISKLRNLTYISVNSATCTGNIQLFSAHTGMTYINFNSTGITGSITFLASFSSISTLSFITTAVTADLSDFSATTSLTNFSVRDTAITGELSDLSGLTNITTLSLGSRNIITGDLSSLATLTSLSSMTVISNTLLTYVTTTLPAWNNSVEVLTSIGLSSSEVDQWLIDSNASGKTGGSINLSGAANAARTSASDTAVSELTGRGVTVTTN